jgi:hypothetical protein
MNGDKPKVLELGMQLLPVKTSKSPIKGLAFSLDTKL